MDATQSVGGHLTAFAFEVLTVDNTTGGVALTASKYAPTTVAELVKGKARLVIATVEGAPLRWTIDGTAPVNDTTGHKAEEGTMITLANYQAMVAFRAIRSGGANATLQITYLR